LEAGWPEIGSVIGPTTASIRAFAANWSFQCIGTNRLPRAWRSVTSARTISLAVGALDLDEAGAGNADFHRIARMDFGKGLGNVSRKTGAFARSRHRMPLVADAAGIERQREVRVGPVRYGSADGNEARLAIGMEEATFIEKPCGARVRACRLRPLKGCQYIVKRKRRSADARRYRNRGCRRFRKPRGQHVRQKSTAAGKENAPVKPMRRATSVICHQSAFAFARLR
jgi:hypothetical protein